MEKKYQLSLYCTKENLPEVSNQLRESVQSSGLLDKVDIFSSQISFVDHGQNPVGDADCRTYIKIKSLTGEEIFQTSDIILRTAHRDFKSYIQRALSAVQRDLKLAA